MTVADASVVVAALVDSGPVGAWSEDRLRDDRLAAPHLMPAEVANVLRHSELAGDLSADVTALGHADLADLPVDLFPYEPFAARVWQLLSNLSAYDAWYVALAEELDTSLVTLDQRLAAAPGPRCRFETPG